MLLRKADAPSPHPAVGAIRITAISLPPGCTHQLEPDVAGHIQHWAKQENRAQAFHWRQGMRTPLLRDQCKKFEALAQQYRDAGWTVELKCAEGDRVWEITVS